MNDTLRAALAEVMSILTATTGLGAGALFDERGRKLLVERLPTPLAQTFPEPKDREVTAFDQRRSTPVAQKPRRVLAAATVRP